MTDLRTALIATDTRAVLLYLHEVWNYNCSYLTSTVGLIALCAGALELPNLTCHMLYYYSCKFLVHERVTDSIKTGELIGVFPELLQCYSNPLEQLRTEQAATNDGRHL